MKCKKTNEMAGKYFCEILLSTFFFREISICSNNIMCFGKLPSWSNTLLQPHLSIVRGFKLPRPLEQTSAAAEKVRSAAHDDAEQAK